MIGESDVMELNPLATLKVETDHPRWLDCKLISHNTVILVPLDRHGSTMETIVWNFEQGFAYRCELCWRGAEDWDTVRP